MTSSHVGKIVSNCLFLLHLANLFPTSLYLGVVQVVRGLLGNRGQCCWGVVRVLLGGC